MSAPTLRLASADDITLIWQCRQELAGSAAIQIRATDDFTHHVAWMKAAITSPDVLFLIPVLDGRAVGYVRFNRDTWSSDAPAQDVWRASICVLADWRARGLGGEILQMACTQAQKVGKSPQIADIHEGNIASQRLFTSCGFVPLSPTPDADGYRRYIRKTSR